MNTSNKVAVVAAGACLIPWTIKKLADQRANDYPLSLLSLIQEIELQKRTEPEPEACPTADIVAVSAEAQGNEKTADTPAKQKAASSQADK